MHLVKLLAVGLFLSSTAHAAEYHPDLGTPDAINLAHATGLPVQLIINALGYTPLAPNGNGSQLTGLTVGQISGLGPFATATSIGVGQITGLGPFATATTIDVSSVTGLGPFATATTIPGASVTGLGALARLGVGTGLASDGTNLNLAAGAAVANLGYTPLAPTGNGSQLTGLTAGQIGGLGPFATATTVPVADVTGLGPFATATTIPVASVTGLGYFATGTDAANLTGTVALARLPTIPYTQVSGLGTAATQNTGTSGATVPLLNGANTWSGNQSFTGGVMALSSSSPFSPQIQSTNSTNDASAPYLLFMKNRAGASVQTSDTLGTVMFQGADSAGNLQQSAWITSIVTGTPTVGNVPTKFQFFTNNGSSVVEPLELSSSLANFGEPVQATQFNGSGAGLTGVPVSGITGLGTAATQNTGTSGATIPLLNGTNTWSATQNFAAINASAVEANTSTYPILEWYASGNGTDIKGSKEFIDPSGSLNFTFINDADSAADSWLTVSRSGITPTLANFNENAQFNSHTIYQYTTAGTTDGTYIQASDNHNISLRASMGSGSNNGIVQAGDQGIIYSGGSADTGAFVIAPWASASGGMRWNAVGDAIETGGLTVTGNLYGGQLQVGSNSTTGTSGFELGSYNHSETPFIDFHTSGTGNDFDVRILASGGSVASGGGSLSVTAGGGIHLIGDTSVQGALSISPLTSSAVAIVNAPSNSYQASTDYEENGAIKWQVGKNVGTDPSYFIYNATLQQTAIGVDYLTNAVTVAGSLTFGGVPATSLVGNPTGSTGNSQNITIGPGLQIQ